MKGGQWVLFLGFLACILAVIFFLIQGRGEEQFSRDPHHIEELWRGTVPVRAVDLRHYQPAVPLDDLGSEELRDAEWWAYRRPLLLRSVVGCVREGRNELIATLDRGGELHPLEMIAAISLVLLGDLDAHYLGALSEDVDALYDGLRQVMKAKRYGGTFDQFVVANMKDHLSSDFAVYGEVRFPDGSLAVVFGLATSSPEERHYLYYWLVVVESGSRRLQRSGATWPQYSSTILRPWLQRWIKQ